MLACLGQFHQGCLDCSPFFKRISDGLAPQSSQRLLLLQRHPQPDLEEHNTQTVLISVTDDSDLTPLHHLLLFNGDMFDTFTLLLRRGADPWKRSHIGAMPIQVARQAGPNCALATILALAPDPRRDIAKLRQVLETFDGFKASDEMVVKQRLIERRHRFKEIESRLREVAEEAKTGSVMRQETRKQ